MWMLLHRHNDPDRASHHIDSTPVVFSTTTGCMFLPRLQDGKSVGCFLRTPGDQARGGLWIRESFTEICDRLEVTLVDREKWLT